MSLEITPTLPVTYVTQRTVINVVPGEEPGERKITETSFDTIVYDKNGQIDPVTRVNTVEYYA
jgi:hypothetical protein